MDKDWMPKYLWETWMRHTFYNIHEKLGIGATFFAQLSGNLSTNISNKLTQPFFISQFLSDDVTRAPDPWLAAAVARCAAEALPGFCWASATTQWDWMHSQGSCFIHPGLYRSLEPTGLPQAVSTVPAPCAVVQTHRWVRRPGPKKKKLIRKSFLVENVCL